MGRLCAFVKQKAGWRCVACGRSVKVDCPEPPFATCREPRTAERVLRRGPGTELKKILSGWPFRFASKNGCGCDEFATYMDRMELAEEGWCSRNKDKILDRLRTAAKARGVPFSRIAAAMILRLAISRASR